MNWRLGTIGFGYTDWAGVFYPPGMKSSDYLAHCAKAFNTVELDTTFHAIPSPERFKRWADVTPAGFRFSVKTPRAVTHEGPPDRAIDTMRMFLDSARVLGDKLGVVLIQLPPHFAFNQFESLATFLAQLPTDIRYAVEFRNRTWGTPRTLGLLREHNCALVLAEYLSRPRSLHVTTDFLYIRWIGEHDRFEKYDHERIDVSESLNWWRDQLATVSPSVQTTWGYFTNDFSGYAVGVCNRFKPMIGEPVVEPPAIPGGLFG